MGEPIASLTHATLRFGQRTLWQQLDLNIQPGEFLAVLGPNGAGKSSLLKALLGLQKLTSGTVHVAGETAHTGNPLIGYIPQQKAFDASLPIRGRDLVHFGVDGARWGFGGSATHKHQKVDEAIRTVGASKYANKPLGKLSGGEQQRLRIAQALVGEPQLLLCDEPLLSLDPASQQNIAKLINGQRERGAAVVFVTHEINPILPYADRVLYIAGGKWRVGKPHEILTSTVLSALYATPVEVLRVHGRVIVLSDSLPTEPTQAHHHLAGEVEHS
ncbi:MAG TPA: ABC transporter ATP-binding protein [Patescibacteria group bacterium]|nr:ABC transporter ATP-binding protein [Patescibacteria group bacterium]